MDQDDAEKENEGYLCHDDDNEFSLKFNSWNVIARSARLQLIKLRAGARTPQIFIVDNFC